MPNFNKSKENRILDVRKRFHFEPKSQHPYLRPAPKPKCQDLIVTDDNGEFSSVKDHNDFNDSSWLARLVNGLEEADNLGGRPLTEISNLISMASSQINRKQLGNLQTHLPTDLKTYDDQPSGAARDNMPPVPNYRCLKGVRENRKANWQAQASEGRGYLGSHLKRSIDEPPKSKSKESRKSITNHEKLPNNKSQPRCRQQKREGEKGEGQPKPHTDIHKSSLVNCSSIREESPVADNHKESQEPIIFDLGGVILKSEGASGITTPLQSKAKSRAGEEGGSMSGRETNQHKGKAAINKNEQQCKPARNQLNGKHKANSSKENDFSNTSQCSYSHIQQSEKCKSNWPTPPNAKGRKKPNSEHQSSNLDGEQKGVSPILPKLKLHNLGKNKSAEVGEPHNKPQDVSQFPKPMDPSSMLTQAQTSQTMEDNLAKNTANTIVPSQSASKIGSIKKNNLKVFQQQRDEKTQSKSGAELPKIPTFSQRPALLQGTTTEATITERTSEKEKSLKRVIGGSLKHLKNIGKRSYQEPVGSASPVLHERTQTRGGKIKLQPARLSAQFSHEAKEKQSPKFNYGKTLSIKNQSSRSASSSSPWGLKRRYAYQQIFRELNANNQPRIHKHNCKESRLDLQKKYEFGALLSRIKYLDCEYTESEFIRECLNMNPRERRTKLKPHKGDACKLNKTSEPKLNSTAKIKVSQRRPKSECRHWEGLKGKPVTNDAKGHKLKTLLQNPRNAKHNKVEKHGHAVSDIGQGYEFEPLFPETACEWEGEGKGRAKASRPQEVEDIGSIIDNLNDKLSKYIQTNNLEDTYRKFKLDFVQLRRNMLY